MSELMTSVGQIFEAIMTMLKTLVATVAGGTVGVGEAAVTYQAQPLLLLFVLIPVAFLGVAMFRKLLNL